MNPERLQIFNRSVKCKIQNTADMAAHISIEVKMCI